MIDKNLIYFVSLIACAIVGMVFAIIAIVTVTFFWLFFSFSCIIFCKIIGVLWDRWWRKHEVSDVAGRD